MHSPGPQTLWGYQLMRGGGARVGLSAGVGDDMPQSVKVRGPAAVASMHMSTPF